MSHEILEKQQDILDFKVEYLSLLIKASASVEIVVPLNPEIQVSTLEEVESGVISDLLIKKGNILSRIAGRITNLIFGEFPQELSEQTQKNRPNLHPAGLAQVLNSSLQFQIEKIDPRKTEHSKALLRVFEDALFSVEGCEDEPVSFLTAVERGDEDAIKVCAEAINFLYPIYSKEENISPKQIEDNNTLRQIFYCMLEKDIDICIIGAQDGRHMVVGRKYAFMDKETMDLLQNAATVLAEFREDFNIEKNNQVA